jgi:hypothetical protein
MPDFLHKDPGHAPDPSHTPAAGAPTPMVRRRLNATSVPGDQLAEGEENSSIIKKPPSRVWTDYYAAVFLLSMAGFIGLGSLLLRPLVLDYRRHAAAIQATAALVTDEQAYLQSVQGSISAAQAIPPETLARVDEALPREASIPKLLQAVALFAEKEDAHLSSVQFTAPDNTPSMDSTTPRGIDIGLSVELSGYVGFRGFLEGVEHSLRLFEMGGVSVSADAIGDAAGSSGPTSYSFQLRTFFLPPPPSTP